MIKVRQKSNTSYPIQFILVQSDDHITPSEGQTPSVEISKNGGAFNSISGSVSEISNGWYSISLAVSDVDTLGDLSIHITSNDADPTDLQYSIVNYNPFDFVSGLVTILSDIEENIDGIEENIDILIPPEPIVIV